MTIPKRNKRRQKRGKLPLPPETKDFVSPPVDRMVHYTRDCPACGERGYSTRCNCGRLTVITKGG